MKKVTLTPEEAKARLEASERRARVAQIPGYGPPPYGAASPAAPEPQTEAQRARDRFAAALAEAESRWAMLEERRESLGPGESSDTEEDDYADSVRELIDAMLPATRHALDRLGGRAAHNLIALTAHDVLRALKDPR